MSEYTLLWDVPYLGSITRGRDGRVAVTERDMITDESRDVSGDAARMVVHNVISTTGDLYHRCLKRPGGMVYCPGCGQTVLASGDHHMCYTDTAETILAAIR